MPVRKTRTEHLLPTSMKSYLAFVFGSALLCASPVFAQDASPSPSASAVVAGEKEPKQFVDAFFKGLETGKVDNAYDQLLVGSKIAESLEVSTLRSKTKDAIREFGDITGYDIADVKPVGDHLVRFTCVSIGKSFPIRWRFYFYNTADHWKLIDIRVDDHIADLFGEQPAESSSSPQ